MTDDALIRFSVFASAFFVLLVVERYKPSRASHGFFTRRWQSNLFVFLVGILLVKLMGPLIALNAAFWSTDQGYGLLNVVALPLAIELFIVLLALDAAIYFQHLLSHRIPLFWRFHRVHHADHEIDVSTALRFHPIEIGFSMLYKCAVVVLLGANWWAVLTFEILLNASAMFNHANISLSQRIDRFLRSVIVTPDMHLVHHSRDKAEQNFNFGFFLSLWDRIFNTYKERRQLESTDNIGLSSASRESAQSFLWQVSSPFRAGAQRDA